MIIQRPYEPRFLMPVPRHEWREPSRSVERDQFGNFTVQTRFVVRGKTHDGVVRWDAWFDDRDQFDAFLWSALRAQVLGEKLDERLLLSLPNCDVRGTVNLDLVLAPEVFAFLTSTSASSTFQSPTDWNNAKNKIGAIGGGGSGVCARVGSSVPIGAMGAGGGAFAGIANFQFAEPGTTTVNYRVGLGGVAVTYSGSSGSVLGNNGAQSYFDAGTVLANFGKAGTAANTSSVLPPGEGGKASSSTGTTKYDGGDGGAITTAASAGQSATGGGGAAGPAGAGLDGASKTGSASGNTKGGDTASGAIGSAGGTVLPGGAGTDWDSTHGAGAGSGGYTLTSASSLRIGVGGQYGGGGGSVTRAQTTGSYTDYSGAGMQGIVVVSYEPGSSLYRFNHPNQGM
jgi:hypothetical protein